MTERRGISAAEKYAELEATGLDRPRCECHGKTMGWGKSADAAAGGYWVCPIKRRGRNGDGKRTNKDGTLRPIYDPLSDKYPDRVFVRGQWMTSRQIKAMNENQRRYREENREKRNEYCRKWNADNAFHRSQHATLYNARKALERSMERANLQY